MRRTPVLALVALLSCLPRLALGSPSAEQACASVTSAREAVEVNPHLAAIFAAGSGFLAGEAAAKQGLKLAIREMVALSEKESRRFSAELAFHLELIVERAMRAERDASRAAWPRSGGTSPAPSWPGSASTRSGRPRSPAWDE
jgi:hypothetical protein